MEKMNQKKLPIVAIVGRPNVGKSTLFNRICGKRKAIVEDVPGVTRDRNYCECEYNGIKFLICDTGGLDVRSEEKISSSVRKQIERTIKESSAIIYLLDVNDGLLPEDEEGIRFMRRFNKPIFFVVNKVESERKQRSISEFYKLGAEKIYQISALHGINIDDLLSSLVETLRPLYFACEEEELEEPLRIAIVGRPNTGKSSIVNAIIGDERVIVSEIPGTTRDAIDTEITFGKRRLIIVDTAGIRKKSKIDSQIEIKSIASAIKSIERSHIVNLVIDANEGPGHQEASIIHTVFSYGKGLVLVINKWDLLEGKIAEDDYAEKIKSRLPHAGFCPIVFVSALTGKNVHRILEMDMEVERELKKRIETGRLNRDLREIIEEKGPPSPYGKRIKIYYATQIETSPPSFLFFSNFPELVPENYKRYIENSLRKRYGFFGVPLRIKFRKK